MSCKTRVNALRQCGGAYCPAVIRRSLENTCSWLANARCQPLGLCIRSPVSTSHHLGIPASIKDSDSCDSEVMRDALALGLVAISGGLAAHYLLLDQTGGQQHGFSTASRHTRLLSSTSTPQGAWSPRLAAADSSNNLTH